MRMTGPEPLATDRSPNLTDLERSVLTALWESSKGNGHDFGLVEDCRGACAVQQLGGVISSLSKKGIISVHEAVTTDSGRWTQTTWAAGRTPKMVEALIGKAAEMNPASPAPPNDALQSAASASAVQHGHEGLGAAAPSLDLLSAFSPKDVVLDAKIQAMLDGEEAILSDKDCDDIADLDVDWTGRFATLPNPQRVGILDAWVGFVKPKAEPSGVLQDSVSSALPASRGRRTSREPHGEEGHLNLLVRDQDSVVTGFGAHNRLVVMAEPDGSMVSAREDFKWDLPEATDEQRRKLLNNETYRMHPKGTRLEFVGSSEPFDSATGKSWTSVMHNYRVVTPGASDRNVAKDARGAVAWKERNANHTASFGDVLMGQCHVRIKQVEGRFNAAYVAPDHSRFDAPTVLGTWDTLDEAKAESLKVLRAQPWCPESVREGLAPAVQGSPKAGPEKGTLWWNADNLEEAEAWKADLLAQGCDSVELKPEADSEHVRVLITLDRARADEILGYPVEEEEWLIFEDPAPVRPNPEILA